MKKQLQGLAILLFSILLTLAWGNVPVFDFSFRWNVIFVILGVVGVAMTFISSLKDNKKCLSEKVNSTCKLKFHTEEKIQYIRV